MSKVVGEGDKVVIHYVGRLTDDGEQFDNSYNRGAPIEVEVGGGSLIKGFEKALIGMHVGEKRHIDLPKEEAYGELNPEAFIEVSKESFPNDFPFDKKGIMVPLRSESGQEFFGRLHETTEETVTVDLNHPMAGKDLSFDIEVIGITAPPEGTEEVVDETTTTESTTETTEATDTESEE